MIDLYLTTPNGYEPLVFLEETGPEYRLVPARPATMFAKSMGVVSWEEACELNPRLRDPLPASPG